MGNALKNIILFFSFLTVAPAWAQPTTQAAAEAPDSLYDIQDSILIRTRDGASVSAIVVRKKPLGGPLPVVLQFTIYVRSTDTRSLKEAADKGYVGVMAYARGKRISTDEIVPYETEHRDVWDVIDWVSRQPWCNGKVGMYGGSYNGFVQWASARKLHPALKTIVPAAASRPGMGLPMENNVFVNPNYEWAFYVTNNRFLDTVVEKDRQRFRNMQNAWWESGVAYRKLDSIDGTPNRFFQRWISHPAYDSYWQQMAPYMDEFAQINIPVLSFDGYYNDSQLSSLYYLRQHLKYLPQAEHYLVIGPYNHLGAQKGGSKVLQGYAVDSVALIDPRKITYEWFDYILRDGRKPEMLKDKINYELMGANEWKHAPSLEQMSDTSLTFYLTNKPSKGTYLLSPRKPVQEAFLSQTVDFADRTTFCNDYYPAPIIRHALDTSSGFFFLSEPLKQPMAVCGSFTGEIRASINKKDMDFGVVLYEVMPNGDCFHLSYFLGRASYVGDITERKLLVPGRIESIPFSNTRVVCRQLSKGSRLLVVVNVNKNSFSQINYGTGKDVSEETIQDAGQPLNVKWYNSSFVRIPVKQ